MVRAAQEAEARRLEAAKNAPPEPPPPPPEPEEIPERTGCVDTKRLFSCALPIAVQSLTLAIGTYLLPEPASNAAVAPPPAIVALETGQPASHNPDEAPEPIPKNAPSREEIYERLNNNPSWQEERQLRKVRTAPFSRRSKSLIGRANALRCKFLFASPAPGPVQATRCVPAKAGRARGRQARRGGGAYKAAAVAAGDHEAARGRD